MWFALLFGAFMLGASFTFLPLALLPFMVLPLCALGAVVIWAFPQRKAAPTRLLTIFYFAFFIGLVLWPNYLAISIPSLPWITVLRLAGFPMVPLTLICLSAPSFRAAIADVLTCTPWVWKLLLAFILIQLITIGFSPSPFSSISKFIVAQVNWTMIFFISCFIFRAPKRVHQWVALLIVMALIVVAIGTWEWRMQRVPWAGHIPSFLAVSDEAVQRILAGAMRLGVIYRTQSTFTTSLSFAEYLALTTPFVVHLAIESESWTGRVAAMLSVPVLFFGVFITNSRLGALGFFLSFLLYLAIWALRRWRSDPASIFGPAVTLGYPAIFGGFVAASLVNLRLYRMIWGGGQYEFSTDARRQQLEMGIERILHWPFGRGIGQAGETLQFYSPAGLLTIDNYYLSIALEYGVVGFVVYYGMFVAAIWYGAAALFRARSYETSFLIPAVIALANFVVIKSVLSQEANHPLAFMLLGLTVALVHRAKTESR